MVVRWAKDVRDREEIDYGGGRVRGRRKVLDSNKSGFQNKKIKNIKKERKRSTEKEKWKGRNEVGGEGGGRRNRKIYHRV
jgi:hypothetical protein